MRGHVALHPDLKPQSFSLYTSHTPPHGFGSLQWPMPRLHPRPGVRPDTHLVIHSSSHRWPHVVQRVAEAVIRLANQSLLASSVCYFISMPSKLRLLTCPIVLSHIVGVRLSHITLHAASLCNIQSPDAYLFHQTDSTSTRISGSRCVSPGVQPP